MEYPAGIIPKTPLLNIVTAGSINSEKSILIIFIAVRLKLRELY